MAQVIVALIATVLMVGMSIVANRKFRDQDRLPMQWLLSGEVTWKAPRLVAVAFVPALGIPIIWATVVLTMFVAPRPGQEGFEIPVVLLMAVIFVAIQFLHIWLIDRHLTRNGK